MGFEKVRLGKGLIFYTEVIDADGRVIEKWRCMQGDYSKALRILNNKFGLNLRILDKQKESDELSWAK